MNRLKWPTSSLTLPLATLLHFKSLFFLYKPWFQPYCCPCNQVTSLQQPASWVPQWVNSQALVAHHKVLVSRDMLLFHFLSLTQEKLLSHPLTWASFPGPSTVFPLSSGPHEQLNIQFTWALCMKDCASSTSVTLPSSILIPDTEAPWATPTAQWPLLATAEMSPAHLKGKVKGSRVFIYFCSSGVDSNNTYLETRFEVLYVGYGSKVCSPGW